MQRSQQEIIAILVDSNTTKSDDHTCSAGTNCNTIMCSECPLNRNTVTLGDIRERDRRNKSEQVKDKPQDIEGVRTPSHYMLFEDVESIQVIARTMTVSEFKGFCLGNVLKYRLRAGKKSELATVEKDLAKADFYKELFAKHKGECRAAE